MAQADCSHSLQGDTSDHPGAFQQSNNNIRGFPAGHGPRMGRPNPRSFDEYLKAYSVAMLPGRERENLSYGGKSTRHPIYLCKTPLTAKKSSCPHQRWQV